MTIEKLNYAKNGPKGATNIIKENQKFVTKTRRETVRQRNVLKTETVKRPKRVQVIWQRLMSGQTDKNNANKLVERTQSPYTQTRITKKSRNEPMWRDLLAIEKAEKKMATIQTAIITKELDEGAEPRTAFSIKMEKRSKKHMQSKRVASPRFNKQNDVENVEPIEEFRVFFDNLFSYLQPRVPIQERDFLIIERDRFNAFFERLKGTQIDEVENETLNVNRVNTNFSHFSFSSKTIDEEAKLSTNFPTSQDGKMIEIATQTSFPTSTNSDNDINERIQESSNFVLRKQLKSIEKIDKATQAPEESEKSSNENTEGIGSSTDSTETESDKNKNKHKSTNKKKNHHQIANGAKAENKASDKTLEKNNLAVISKEIEALEKIKETFLQDANMHHLLKSLRCFYKQLRKEQRQEKEKDLQIDVSQQKSNFYDYQQSEVFIDDIKHPLSTQSIQIIANNSLTIIPRHENNFYLQQKRHNPTMHVAFEDAVDLNVNLENLTIPSPIIGTSKRNKEIPPYNNSPKLENEFPVEKKTLGNGLLATKDSLENIKKDIENRTKNIEQENIELLEPTYEWIATDGSIVQFPTNLKEDIERQTNYIGNMDYNATLASTPTYEWLAEDGSVVRYPTDFLNEQTSIVTDQIEKSTLDHLKQKCMDLQRVQDLEIQNALRDKPEINENELLHKLDSNMDEMQTDLIKLGKYYNYLPLGFFNRTYNEKWHSNHSQESSLLLESFKHCYPQQSTNSIKHEQNLPDLKIKNEMYK